jgi:uncharacterized glyoxalase superfamily protein PhnB
MRASLTPMIHVPDVRAAAAWYASIGFDVLDIGEDGVEAVFALLGCGDGRLMLNAGGVTSEAPRREADLYLHTTDIDALFAQIGDRAVVVEPPHDTFYGMREFIIRDLNGFWLTFGQPTTETP